MSVALPRMPLVEVFCKNPACSPVRGKRVGGRVLVGRISARAELRCPSCRQVALYEVG